MNEKKKVVVITAGGTSEPIDGVRKITNTGTGRLAAHIAEAFMKSDKVEKVIYIYAGNAFMPNEPQSVHKLEAVGTNSVMDVKEAVEGILKMYDVDIFIHAMAVSDYMMRYIADLDDVAQEMQNLNPKYFAEALTSLDEKYRLDSKGKISSDRENLVIMLRKAPKIISLIKKMSPQTELVGFKLLNGDSDAALIEAAVHQIQENGCSYVVANNLSDVTDKSHTALLIGSDGRLINKMHSCDEIANTLSAMLLG